MPKKLEYLLFYFTNCLYKLTDESKSCGKNADEMSNDHIELVVGDKCTDYTQSIQSKNGDIQDLPRG